MTEDSAVDLEAFVVRLALAEHVRDTALGLLPPEIVAVLAAKLPLLHKFGTALHPTVDLPEGYSDALEIIVGGLERQLALFDEDLGRPFEHRYVCLQCGWRNDVPAGGINCPICGTSQFCTWVPIPTT